MLLADALTKLGFECFHLPFGEGDAHVPNLFARLGTGSPHICYVGHTDVVPTGPVDEWTFDPFDPQIVDGKLYGRGSSDMKGSVAAFICAVDAYIKQSGTLESGSISLLITGDEEGPAFNGTVKVLEWMEENGHIPDVALGGEPTNPTELGQEIKIGRRGSLSGRISVKGKQGHVAYQHLADNPLPRLLTLLDTLATHIFDTGSEYFPATNLELTGIDVDNPADNVIPGSGAGRFNVRFNDQWSGDSLADKIRELLDSAGIEHELELFYGNAESFLTKPGIWSDIVLKAVEDATGKTPKFTTNGGTSDARFIVKYCPTIECGPVNATIHQIDECAEIEVLEKLTDIYEGILKRYFA